MKLAAVLMMFVATPAFAQARGGSFEIAPGAVWFSGMNLGSSTATLERSGGGEFELFRTETKLDPGFGGAATLSFYLTPRAAIEAGFSYARLGASTSVSDDAEGAPPVTSDIGLQQYLIEGNLRWYLARPRAAWRPFIRAGGGYLRQLDDSSAHVETGKSLQAGVGVDRAFRDRDTGTVKRAGLRLDVRAIARTGGFDIDDSLRLGFSAGALLFIGF
jgi:hypothetical protein